HISWHCLNTLCEIGDGARSQWKKGSEGALGNMAERQERKLLAALVQRNERVGVADLKENVAVGEHCPLWRPRRAGRIDKQCQIIGPGAPNQLCPKARIGGGVVAAKRQQSFERQHLRVAESRQPLDVKHDDFVYMRAAPAHLKVLVELLIVL